ncbi:MAG: PorP/SprF family type IX secretion system membrane protein [Prolixibacteraceae bacterium]
MGIILCLFPLCSLAQYDFNAGQVLKTIEFYNPGYNASKDCPTAVVLYRGPFQNNQNLLSPNYINDLEYTTNAVNLYVPFLKTKTGISVNVINEKLGHRENTIADLAFDVAVRTSQVDFLSLGIAAGVNLWQYDLTNAFHNYGNIEIGNYNSTFPYVGVGLNFFKRGHHLGISYHLTSPKPISKTDFNPFTTNDDIRLYQTLYANLSIQIPLSNNMHLKPFIIFKNWNFTPNNYLIEGGVNLLLSDRVWIGGAYRESWVTDAYSIMLDFKVLDYLRLGYSYEKNLNDVGFFASSIHEIRMQIRVPRKEKDAYLPQAKQSKTEIK